MDLKIAKWSDFNNVSVKLTIGRKKYNAMLLIIELIVFCLAKN